MVEGKVATLDGNSRIRYNAITCEELATIANLLQAPVRNVAYAVKAVAEKATDAA